MYLPPTWGISTKIFVVVPACLSMHKANLQNILDRLALVLGLV